MTAVGQPSEILPFTELKQAYRALGDLSPAPVCDRLLVLERRHATDDGRGQTSPATLARRLRSSRVLGRVRNPSWLSLSPRRGLTSRGEELLLDDDAASAGEEADGSCRQVVVVLDAGWVVGGCTEYHAGRLITWVDKPGEERTLRLAGFRPLKRGATAPVTRIDQDLRVVSIDVEADKFMRFRRMSCLVILS